MSALFDRVMRYATEFASAGAETGLEATLIAAICERETECGDSKLLDVRGPAGKGDDGFGHGLMQLDSRTWGDWLAKNPWWIAAVNILKGAQILALNKDRFANEGALQMFCAVAAYNCGPRNVRTALAGLPDGATDDQKRAAIDKRTAHGNYASSVLAIWAQLKELATGSELIDQITPTVKIRPLEEES